MEKNKFRFGMLMLLGAMLMSCFGNMNTVETCVLSHEQYNDKAILENAKQPERFESGRDIYASVRFIESPLGMEYTGKWFIDNNEIKTETKAMITDRHGILIFTLEAEKTTAGKIRFDILYGAEVLFSKEISVQ